MSKRNTSFLDQFGNYLCALGNSGEKPLFLVIPLAIALLILVVFWQISGAFVPAIIRAIEGLELTKTMASDIEMVLGATKWAWLLGGLMMLWQRQRAAVNALQTAISTIFYLTIAFGMIGKIYLDITTNAIKTEGLGIVIYAVTLVLVLIILCLVALLATVLGTPIVASAAVLVGVGFDLVFNYLRAESTRSSRCFKAIQEVMLDVNVEKEIAEVQVIDSGIYFVNPALRVVQRIDFVEYDFSDLNMWTQKPFLSLLMKELPDGYMLESLRKMWVANNAKLMNHLSEMEVAHRRAQAKSRRGEKVSKTEKIENLEKVEKEV